MLRLFIALTLTCYHNLNILEKFLSQKHYLKSFPNSYTAHIARILGWFRYEITSARSLRETGIFAPIHTCLHKCSHFVFQTTLFPPITIHSVTAFGFAEFEMPQMNCRYL